MSVDLEGYARHLDGVAAHLPDVLRDELGAGMHEAALQARALAAARLRGAPSGDLDAIRGEANARLEGRVYGDTSDTVWLRVQEEGGTIRPRTSPWLYVPAPDGGVRKVRQVTLRGRHFIRDGFTNALPEVRRRLGAALAREVTLAG